MFMSQTELSCLLPPFLLWLLYPWLVKGQGENEERSEGFQPKQFGWVVGRRINCNEVQSFEQHTGLGIFLTDMRLLCD